MVARTLPLQGATACASCVECNPARSFGIIPSMTPRSAAASSALNLAFRFSEAQAAAVERCWKRADSPAGWALTRSEFQIALERGVAQRFSEMLLSGAIPADKHVASYLDALHARDLAMALACGAGNEAAWEIFVTEHRQELYRAARAIVGKDASNDPAARDLADSLYADLYGLRESEGARKSLFDYFHGRSKLSTWLRAVLAQRYVDEIRRTQKMQPIENEEGDEHLAIAGRAETAKADAFDPERPKHLAMLQGALVAGLDALTPRERLRLAYYYSDGRTLAEIGRMLGEHEATVSRKLDRIRRDLRRAIETRLRDEKKLSKAQVQACFEYAREEWPFDLGERLRSQ